MGEVLYPNFKSRLVKFSGHPKNHAVVAVVNPYAFGRLMERVVRDGYRSEDHLLATLIERELGLAAGGASPIIKLPDERA
jgi:hypothetical protein